MRKVIYFVFFGGFWIFVNSLDGWMDYTVHECPVNNGDFEGMELIGMEM